MSIAIPAKGKKSEYDTINPGGGLGVGVDSMIIICYSHLNKNG
ncbi:MAG: hypothetical protein HPY66_3442 [Firmicutes bacterium]|nr:hypothetical protein [Bacillota bacterium]